MIAVDANILIYAEDETERFAKGQTAGSILTRLGLGPGGVVPVQVLGEYGNVCRRKALASAAMIRDRVLDYAIAFDTPQTTPDDILDAAALADRYLLQFFDALIVTVAARAGATILLSEDLHDGLKIADLEILNPFNPGNESAIEALLT